jgi:hypothetical protein
MGDCRCQNVTSNRVLVAELLSNFKPFIIKFKRKSVSVAVRYASHRFATVSSLPSPTLKKSQNEVLVERLESWYQMKSKKWKEIW